MIFIPTLGRDWPVVHTIHPMRATYGTHAMSPDAPTKDWRHVFDVVISSDVSPTLITSKHHPDVDEVDASASLRY